MLFDWNVVAAPSSVQDLQLSAPLTLSGEGLWVCLVSSGKCTASVPGAGPSPAGAALILPPQSVPAGHLILSRAPLSLVPESTCHLLCVQLTGQAASQFLTGLRELPFLAKGGSCPAAAELMGRLAEEKSSHSRARSQLAYALLCEHTSTDCEVVEGERNEEAWFWNRLQFSNGDRFYLDPAGGDRRLRTAQEMVEDGYRWPGSPQEPDGMGLQTGVQAETVDPM